MEKFRKSTHCDITKGTDNPPRLLPLSWAGCKSIIYSSNRICLFACWHVANKDVKIGAQRELHNGHTSGAAPASPHQTNQSACKPELHSEGGVNKDLYPQAFSLSDCLKEIWAENERRDGKCPPDSAEGRRDMQAGSLQPEPFSWSPEWWWRKLLHVALVCGSALDEDGSGDESHGWAAAKYCWQCGFIL